MLRARIMSVILILNTTEISASEIRGNSSAGFPKKSYTVETRFPDGTNLNFPLLGMPAENDWVFMVLMPTNRLCCNVLAYNLGNKTGKWSPRTRFFELYLKRRV